MSEEIPYKIYLSEKEIPTNWYNVRADMKNKPAPLLNPGTHQPLTLEELERELMAMAAEDPEVPVLVRGDERNSYGDVMKVVKVVYKCKIHRMALVTVEK